MIEVRIYNEQPLIHKKVSICEKSRFTLPNLDFFINLTGLFLLSDYFIKYLLPMSP